MKQKLPKEVREFFVQEGAKGGKKRAQRLTAEQRKQIARKAASVRAKRLTSKQRKQIAQKAAAARWVRRTK